MRNAGGAPRSRIRTLLVLVVALVTAVAGLTGCGTRTSEPKVLADKGTPYQDLLVPKLTGSIKNEAVGVPVDQPVSLTVQGGVFGSVTMADDAGETVKGDVTPAGRVARFVHKGPYETVGTDYNLLMAWLEKEGLKMDVPAWEVYLNDPDQVPPEELLTECSVRLA